MNKVIIIIIIIIIVTIIIIIIIIIIFPQPFPIATTITCRRTGAKFKASKNKTTYFIENEQG